MKLCNDHRYMLVNYDENELGTTAPELWELKFGPGYDLLSKTADGSITALRAPGKVRGNASYQWGEASFAGPAHDVIVCEVDGVITFFRFDRHQGPSSLKLIDPGMTPPDFGEFYHPIFTWGDTVQHPLMVATDLDGAGNLCIWSDAEPSDA
ncbi:hypothetical protein SCHPADRAFT_281798 [Schizopora paradoxa]|uniref:Uncharacterized protein n=1 Tax=Schizopora paradoxa TaxID=27342 RepID=A0A0H2RU74_9AGAM|nr:hypothetical protein SCHPADRAFT_281798 [Schizopora paradoxa]